MTAGTMILSALTTPETATIGTMMMVMIVMMTMTIGRAMMTGTTVMVMNGTTRTRIAGMMMTDR